MPPSNTRPNDKINRPSLPATSAARSEAAIRYQNVLAPHRKAMALMAEWERIEHSREAVDMDAVKRLYDRLQLMVQKLIVALGDLGDDRSGHLLKAHQQLDRQTTPLFEPVLSRPSHPVLVPLEEVRADMAPFVGHKAAQLAVIDQTLSLPVPRGFVLTASAFDRFMEKNELSGMIKAYLRDLTVAQPELIEERCETIRRLILEARVPDDIQSATKEELEQWRHDQNQAVFTAVRSTAIGEDGEISFAGQFATLLNIPAQGVLDAYKEVLASKYSPGAVLYRMRYGLEDRSTPMAVMVMAMVPAQASGVLYTRNPSRPDQIDLQISAIRGLGEYLMSGDIAPHVLSIGRRTGRVRVRHTTRQSQWIVACPEGGTRLEDIPPETADEKPISDPSARCLADWGERLEKAFGAPQDVEWAIGEDQRLYILQSRSLGLDGPSPSENDTPISMRNLPVLSAGGRKACSGLVSGRIFHADQAISRGIPADSILVIPKAAPEYAPTVALVRGVVAAKGSEASHLASVAREFGVPMIVDAGPINDHWTQGKWVTLYADKATIYEGRAPATEGEPVHPLADPFESPVRRRLRALSNRITRRRLSSSVATESAAPPPHSFHDLLWQAHQFAMETLHSRQPETDNSIRVIHWAGDNAAGDFRFQTPANHPHQPLGQDFLRSLWAGMSGYPINKTPGSTLGVEGYALVGHRSIYAALPLGPQQATIDVCQPPASTPTQIRICVMGGAGPYYQRCLRTWLVASILDNLGFTLRIDGAHLEASIASAAPASFHGILNQVGRLLAFNGHTDQPLIGPWVLEDLRNAFLASNHPPPFPSVDLPKSFRPLFGNWRQAMLNNRPVVVLDGSAVNDTPMPYLEQLEEDHPGGYQAFLQQLCRDHFFPMAIAKASHINEGQVDLAVNLLGGHHACTGGIVFGFRDPSRHFLLGLDAVQKRIVLYEIIHGRRFKRLRKRYPVAKDLWYDISLRISGLSIHIQLNGVPTMAYTADHPPGGRVGLWAWADTLIVFDRLALMSGSRQEIAF